MTNPLPTSKALRYGPTADQLHTLRTAFQNERSGRVPEGFRRTVENVLTEVFQAGLQHDHAATRQAVLKEVRERWIESAGTEYPVGDFGAWLDTQLKENET